MWEAKERCPRVEFLRWQKFYEQEPWGENESKWQLAVIYSLLLNSKQRRGRRKINPKDLMCRPRFKRKQSWEDHQTALMAWVEHTKDWGNAES